MRKQYRGPFLYVLFFFIPYTLLLSLDSKPFQGCVVFPSGVRFNYKQQVGSQKQDAGLINFLCVNHISYRESSKDTE